MPDTDILELFNRTIAHTRQWIAGVKPDQWHAPTNSDWDVFELVSHIIGGLHFAAEWAQGRLQTMEEMAAARGQNALRGDPLTAFDERADEVRRIMAAPGFVSRPIRVPFMPAPIPGAALIGQRITELALHGWDLAHSTHQDERLDQDICQLVYEQSKPTEQMLRQSGQFGSHVDVPDDADIQMKTLALMGRDPRVPV